MTLVRDLVLRPGGGGPALLNAPPTCLELRLYNKPHLMVAASCKVDAIGCQNSSVAGKVDQIPVEQKAIWAGQKMHPPKIATQQRLGALLQAEFRFQKGVDLRCLQIMDGVVEACLSSPPIHTGSLAGCPWKEPQNDNLGMGLRVLQRQ